MRFDSPPWPQFGESEEQAVLAAVRSGVWWRNEGRWVGGFERCFAELECAPYVIGVTNGTQALELALAASPVRRGQGVIVPALTFYSSLSAVQRHGAVAVIADVDLETWGLALPLPDTAVQVGAIMPVHLGGVPVDMVAVADLARRQDLFLIQDAAHGPGIAIGERGLTAFGGAVCYSFQQSKLLPAGEGGAVSFECAEAYERSLLLQNCGRAPGDPGYDHSVIGSNLRMPELTGALLCAQLERYDRLTRRRADGAAVLREQLARIDGLVLQERPEFDCTASDYMIFARLDAPGAGAVARDRLVARLQSHGVPVNRVYPLLFDLDAYWLSAEPGVSRAELRERCPNAVTISETAFGVHHRVLLSPRKHLLDLAGLIADAVESERRAIA